MDNTDTVTLEVTEEEVTAITMSLGLLICMLDEDLEEKHEKEIDLEEMMFLMDKKFGAMNLWRKVLIQAGADPEKIAEHINKNMSKG
jgi:hypothetical protein